MEEDWYRAIGKASTTEPLEIDRAALTGSGCATDARLRANGPHGLPGFSFSFFSDPLDVVSWRRGGGGAIIRCHPLWDHSPKGVPGKEEPVVVAGQKTKNLRCRP